MGNWNLMWNLNDLMHRTDEKEKKIYIIQIVWKKNTQNAQWQKNFGISHSI